MRTSARFFWPIRGTIGRLPYVLIGLILVAIKFGIDWTIATQIFERPWSPINYLIWPGDHVARIFDLDQSERAFAVILLFVSLPFVYVGVTLTLRRLRSAGLPPALVLLFFVPLVNLFLFLILALLPTRQVASEGPPANATILDVVPADGSLSYWRSGLIALAVTVPCILLAMILGAQIFQSYGFSLFVGSPFAVGLISVLVFGSARPKPFGACLAVAFGAAGILGAALLVVAIEGLVCLLMAAPIAFVLVFLGASVGYAIQSRAWLNEHVPRLTAFLLLLLPLTMAAEWMDEPEPLVRRLETEVTIDAEPADVWRNVVSFPPLAEPEEWLFRSGIAYPQRAEIVGRGVGAVRRCVFSTGTFVEPIETWEEPRLLRFQVTEQPEPMREWSLYTIHPAHLDGYLVSRRGQFQLEALPGGRTRLVGTTWYSNRMWPAPYWGLWSDFIIHRIHTRVLEHIKLVTEQQTATRG